MILLLWQRVIVCARPRRRRPILGGRWWPQKASEGGYNISKTLLVR